MTGGGGAGALEAAKPPVATRPPSPPPKPPYPTPAAILLVVLLLAGVLIAYLDRQVMALLAPAVKAAFQLSDTRIGLLQGAALNVCFGLAALLSGAAVDRFNRVRLVALSAVAWSAFTALSGAADGFSSLFIARMGVGLSEAALVPAAYSLIGDLFPPARRATAAFVFYGGVILGASGGLAVGGAAMGLIGAHAATLPFGLANLSLWRLTFFAAAAPGLLLALLLIAMPEPPRGEDPADGEGTGSRLRPYLRRHGRALGRLIASLVLVGIGGDALLMWLPTLLARRDATAPNVSAGWLAVVLAVGAILGVGLATSLTRRLRQRHGEMAQLKVLAYGSCGVAALAPLLCLARSPHLTYAACLPFFVFSYAANAVGPSILLTVAPSRLRGRVYAAYVCGVVLAAAIWPAAIGVLSDRVFAGPGGLALSLWAIVIPASLAAPLMLIGLQRPLGTAVAAAALEGTHV